MSISKSEIFRKEEEEEEEEEEEGTKVAHCQKQ